MLERSRLVGYLLVFMIATSAFLPRYSATTPNSIGCNGQISDWAQDEKCGVRNGTEFYVTWNATHVFFAWNGTNLDGEGDLFIYLNTTVGGCNQTTDWSGTHTLPFLADYGYCVENAGYYALRSASSGWNDMGITLPSPYIGYSNNRLTELALTRESIGNPVWLEVVAFLQEETSSRVLVSYPTKNAIGHTAENFTAYYSFRLIDGYSPATMCGINDLDTIPPNIINLEYNASAIENMQIYINYTINEIGGGLNHTYIRYTTNNWATFTDLIPQSISGDYFSGNYSACIGSYNAGTLVEFAIFACDFSGNEFWLNNNSENYKIHVYSGLGGDSQPPSISSTMHSPTLPVVGQKINITTVVTDNVGVSVVYLHWTTDNWANIFDTQMYPFVNGIYYLEIGPFTAGTTVKYVIHALDTSNNEAWDNNYGQDYVINVGMDVTPPVIDTPSHVPSSPISGEQITIFVNVTDVNSITNVFVRYTTNNWSSYNDEVMENVVGTEYSANIGSFASGTWIYYAICAVDGAGNTAWMNNNNMNYLIIVGSGVDQTPPIITDVMHTPLTPLPGANVVIQAHVFDESGIQNVSVGWTSNNWQSVNYAMMTNIGNNDYSVSIGGFSDGTTVYYFIRAYDVLGNVAYDTASGFYYTFTVSSSGDDIPPYIESHSLIPSAPMGMQNVSVLCNAYDYGSGMRNVTIRWTDNNWATFTDTNMSFVSQIPYYGTFLVSYSAVIPGKPVGTRVYYCFRAFDNAGNVFWDNNNGNNYMYEVTQYGDVTPPTIISVEHTPTSPMPTQNVTISASATDSGTGIYRVVVHWTYDAWATIIDTNMTLVSGSTLPGEVGYFVLTLAPFPEGTIIEYVIFADDFAGLRTWSNNFGQNYKIKFNSSGDGNAPMIANVNTYPVVPTAGVNITISAVVVDTESGVNGVYLVWTTDGWATVKENKMNLTTGDTYSYMIGAYAANTVVIYCIKAVDNVGHVAWANNNGANFQFTVQNPQTAPVYIWGTYYQPTNPNPTTAIYISTTTNNGVSVEIVWTTDNWVTINHTPMYVTYVSHAPPYNAYHGGSLGPFAANTTIKFALHGTNIYGNEGWDNNNGLDYTIVVTENGDSYAPSISSTTFTPETPTPTQNVTISTSVIDSESGVMSVIMHWTPNSWVTIYDTNMTFIGGDVYACTIGPFADGTRIEFAIRAEDYAGHVAWDNNGGYNYVIIVSSSGDVNPPVISNIVYSPSNPTTSTNITISCDVVDTGLGVSAVYLVWTSTNWASYYEDEMLLSFNSKYVKNIGSFAGGTVIWFAIKAVDVAGNLAWNSNYGNNYFIIVEGEIDTIPPTISGTSHSPEQPNSTTNVTISATITDNVGVASAYVRWTIDNWQTITDTQMNALGNVYGAKLPTFSAGTTLIYCIKATDTSGNVRWDNNNGYNYRVTIIGNALPVITNVKHTPIQPLVTDVVVITADVSDDDLKNVTLVWTDNNWATVKTDEMSLVSNMTYRAAIGPFSAGTVVEYCIRAYDYSNNLAWNSNFGMNYVFTVYASDMTPPIIWNTTWSPLHPIGGESVTITTQVSDSSPVTVYFYHTIDNWATISQPVMFFTGSSYKYTVTYPAGTTVIFVIKAVDAYNNTAWDNNHGLDYSFTITSSDIVPPSIWNTTHMPTQPVAGTNVTITTRVVDNVGISSVILHWTNNGWASIYDNEMNLIGNGLYSYSIGPLPEGVHIEYVIHAIDTSNNHAWDNNGGMNYHIYVQGTSDLIPPVITNVSQVPNAGSVSPNDVVTIQANVYDNNGLQNVTLVWTSNSWLTLHADDMAQVSSGVYVYSIGPFESGTTVEYCIRAIDNSGNLAWNSNNNQNYKFTVTSNGDAIKPAISGTMHTPESPKPTDTIVIKTTVTDENSGVKNVTLYWTNNNWLSVIETPMQPSAGNLYICTIGPFAAGTKVEYVIRAYDFADNVAWDNNNWQNYAFTVTNSGDAQPPVISNVRAIPGEPKPTDSVTIQASVTDSGGIANVYVNYTTDNWVTYTQKTMTKTTGDTYSCVIGTFANGVTVIFKVIAIDSSGNYANVERSFTVTLTGDSKGPVISQVTWSPITPKPTEQALIKANVTDTSLISSVMLVYTTDNWSSAQEVSMSNIVADDYIAKIGPFADGTIVKFRIVAKDSAGNVAYSNSTNYSFVVSVSGDAVAPSILGIGITPASPKPTEQIIVNATVVDSQSGVKNVFLNYTTNNWVTYEIIDMSCVAGNNYVAKIGPFANGTTVIMKIESWDFANNRGVKDTWKDGALIAVKVLTTGDSIAPEITQITVIPAIPKAGEQVIVSCYVFDSSGVASVYFVYSTDNWTTQHNVRMNESVGGKYVCVGFVYQEGQVVQFNIQAIDIFGNRGLKEGGKIAGEGADVNPPVFVSFSVTQVGNKVYVVWETDEDTIGTVEFTLYNVTTTREEPIWGKTHNMTFTVTSDHVGAVYTFRIVAKDRNGNTAYSSPKSITISQSNHAPELSQPSVSPAKGDVNTKFIFSVSFYDADGDEPAFVAVIIDGAVKAMTLKDGKHVFTTKLSAGKHTYYFRTSDGTDDGLVELKNGDKEWTLTVGKVEGSTINTLLVIGIIGAVVAIVAAVGIFLAMRGRMKGKGESGTEPIRDDKEGLEREGLERQNMSDNLADTEKKESIEEKDEKDKEEDNEKDEETGTSEEKKEE